jgi:3',5'-cyclic-AMP phosphodiesterase
MMSARLPTAISPRSARPTASDAAYENLVGLWNGIPFHIQRALAHQVAFDLVTEGHIPGSHEAPDYSHVNVSGGQIVIHQCSFLYAGPRYSLHDKAALDGLLE